MIGSLIAELRRRKVFRIAGGYLVAAWVTIQIAVALEDALELPGWFDGFVVSALAVLFPIALILAWAFELTPDGVKLSSPPATPEGRRANAGARKALLLIAVCAGAGLGAYWFASEPSPNLVEQGTETIPEAANPNDIDGIAVLPLSDSSTEASSRQLAMGISDELRNVLSRVQGIRVASRPSSLAYSARGSLPASEIAAGLGVRYILDGSLQSAGNKIRVTVQLIDGETDTQIMSRRFDLGLSVDNIFAIQDQIANEVVASLGRPLGQNARGALRFQAAGATDNLDAYRAYLDGRQKFFSRNRVTNPGEFEAITQEFRKAVALDPQFGHAWAALAMQLYTSIAWGADESVMTKEARSAAETALALEPNLALAHAVLGMTETLGDGRPNRVAAIDSLSRAIEIDPLEPTLWSWRGQHWIELGFYQRGIEDLENTIELSISNGVANFWTINAWLLQGDIEQAMERTPEAMSTATRYRLLRGIAAASHPNNADVRTVMLAADGYDAITKAAADALTLEDYDHASAYESLVAAAGDDEGLNRLLQRPVVLYVFKRYGKLPKEVPLSGRLTWWFAAYDDFRRSEARYRYFHDLGLSDYWWERGFPPQCQQDSSKQGFSCR